MRRIALLALSLGLVLGCGDSKTADSGKQPAEAPGKTTAEAPAQTTAEAADPGGLDGLGGRVWIMYRDIGAVVDKHGDDCAALAPAAVEALTKHMDTLTSMSSTIGSPEAKKWKEDNKQLTVEFRRKFAKVQHCARQDPALLDIFKQLGQLRRVPTQ